MENKSDCIIVNHVNKFFGERQVLKDVTLQVPYGSIYGLLGPSGCGKTTTVKIMAGISESSSGETFVLGRKMPQLSLMKEIGYMAQSDALYTALSAAENLEFYATIYGMKKEQYKKRMLEVMELMNLSDDLYKPVAAYSGGMKRRLSLAMAMLQQPKVLILDEPTVGIDPLLRKDIWRELYKMSNNGVTILVTTHVMDEAEKCHQLAMMRNGLLIAQGTPKELQREIGVNSIEEAFIYYGGGKYED
ncbi:MAG TPA: ABC transporter ATP-binding protein [Bacillota bacterium]|uniref:ABC transporter ATP-binding protein n=1 Tax=Sinanaerobacter chloroacetimidivorans TaxID=2818044 RepID=A0A8J7W201_9FIRM|nr:ABC transporter ATP-binding protein [Sinanaerobacter chloroacetimidivorans]MBR0597646.1 ABC transporter ATP-binding protein [Sinanaerobacter chloroacetimidivorans]HML36175.1 ABC transporter ATP-binding protein [Bacillota bacterium]